MRAILALVMMTFCAAPATRRSRPRRPPAAESATVDKVVYHIDDATEQALKGLRNIRNQMETAPNTKIIVVAHGDGVDFLLDGARDPKTNDEYGPLISGLKAMGVTFEVCEITMKRPQSHQGQIRDGGGLHAFGRGADHPASIPRSLRLYQTLMIDQLIDLVGDRNALAMGGAAHRRAVRRAGATVALLPARGDAGGRARRGRRKAGDLAVRLLDGPDRDPGPDRSGPVRHRARCASSTIAAACPARSSAV